MLPFVHQTREEVTDEFPPYSLSLSVLRHNRFINYSTSKRKFILLVDKEVEWCVLPDPSLTMVDHSSPLKWKIPRQHIPDELRRTRVRGAVPHPPLVYRQEQTVPPLSGGGEASSSSSFPPFDMNASVIPSRISAGITKLPLTNGGTTGG